MDENLNWKSETSHVANKVSKCIGIFLKNPLSIYLQNFYEHYIFLQFIHMFFYCNLVWASAYRTNRIHLEILRKRVIRTVAKTPFDAHNDPIFQNLGILKFHDNT